MIYPKGALLRSLGELIEVLPRQLPITLYIVGFDYEGKRFSGTVEVQWHRNLFTPSWGPPNIPCVNDKRGRTLFCPGDYHLTHVDHNDHFIFLNESDANEYKSPLR